MQTTVSGRTDVSHFFPPTAPFTVLESEISELGPASSPPSLDCSLGTSFPQPPPSPGAAKTSYSWMRLLCRASAVAALPPLCHSLRRGPANFPPPHLMAYLAGFSASLGIAFFGSKLGCLSSSSLKEHPWCLDLYQFATQFLFPPDLVPVCIS